MSIESIRLTFIFDHFKSLDFRSHAVATAWKPSENDEWYIFFFFLNLFSFLSIR